MNDSTINPSLKFDTKTRSGITLRTPFGHCVPGLTILAHADCRRIGERAAMTALEGGQDVELSRLSPAFSQPGQEGRQPLADLHLSRRGLRFSKTRKGGLEISNAGKKIRARINGKLLGERHMVTAQALDDGVVLTLADKVALLLHTMAVVAPQGDDYGLIGASVAMHELRQEIARVADLDISVLLRGETGTGKELVANAIHRASPRRNKPFLAINMGAIPPSLAAAELFGSAKGAFTGANRKRPGYFVRATQGSLFLDEVGETPSEVQAMLLRTLETRIVQPVGADNPLPIDVRILAATDADLENDIDEGRFRAPLLHRLCEYEVHLPTLRQRKDDIGRLLIHFLRQELQTLGETWRLDDHQTRTPWLSAPLVAKLAAYSWPGNVRQLRNMARQLVVGSRGASSLHLSTEARAVIDSDINEAHDLSQETTQVNLVLPTTAEPTEPGTDAIVGPETGRPVLRTLLVSRWVDAPWAEALGPAEVFELRGRLDHRIRTLLIEHEGLEVEKRDGFSLIFERPFDAVAFALAVHRNLAEFSPQAGLPIATRIGIHLEEVLLQRNLPAEVAHGAKAVEAMGLSDSTAVHLALAAAAGQTLTSRSVFDLAHQAADCEHLLAEPEVRWLRHGNFALTGRPHGTEVCEIGVAGLAPLQAPTGLVTSGDQPERRPVYRSARDVDEERLLATLRQHQFRLQPTAAALGIARTSLYGLIDQSSRIRKAKDLSSRDIETSRQMHDGNLDAMASELEVSRRGLSRRMTQLGLT